MADDVTCVALLGGRAGNHSIIDGAMKTYIQPTITIRLTDFDLCKAYPWSDMPGTGGYAYPQVKENPSLTEKEEEWGKLW